MIKVVVKFDPGISGSIQAKSLFDLEASLRRMTRSDVRVFKDRAKDDSKLRVKMTPIERAKV